MDRVGEVDGRGAARQLDDLALGREAEDLVGIHLQLHGLEEILVILFAVELLRQAGEPLGRVHGERVLGRHAVAVGPVRGDAGLGDLVHLAGADLHLDPLAVAPRDRRVDRAVAVRLGLADVVLEAPRHRAPAAMDGTKRAVAGVFAAGDDAEAVDVGEPGEA